MKRIALIAGVALAVSAGITGVLVSAEVPPFDPASTKVRHDVDDDGVPVTIYEPNYPDPATVPTPAAYGDFLLVPWGTMPNDVPNTPARPLEGRRRTVTDRAEIEANVLYSRPAEFPAAWSNVREDVIAVFDDLGAIEVTQSYRYTNDKGQSRSVEIFRMRPALPWRVAQPNADSVLSLERGSVGGSPAVFKKPRIAEDEEGSYDIFWFDGEILSQLHGGGVFNDLLSLAESMRASDASMKN